MAMPQCCYLAKGAKRPSHTTNTIKFDRIPFDPCNSIKRFDLSLFDQKISTYLQPPCRVGLHFAPNFERFDCQVERANWTEFSQSLNKSCECGSRRKRTFRTSGGILWCEINSVKKSPMEDFVLSL